MYKRLTGGYWDIQLTSNRILRCYPENTSASNVLYAGLFDYHEMHFLLRYLRSGDNFLDVGANVGVYTLLASSVIDNGMIHAVEPSSKARIRLEENIQINQLVNVVVHPVAVCDTPGPVFLTAAKDSLNHLTGTDTQEDMEQTLGVCLDGEVGAIQFAVGKMDVEGAEVLAMRGAVRMLTEQNPPVWILESNHLCRHFGHTNEMLGEMLAKYGYCLAIYDAEGNHLSLIDGTSMGYRNILAISAAEWSRVCERLAIQKRSDAQSCL